MSQTIYAVRIDSWWDCSDTGHDESSVLGAFTTKDLAVRFIVKEVEDARKSLLNKYEDILESCKEDEENYIEHFKGEIERIKNFNYDVWEIRKDGHLDVTPLVGDDWWGDNNFYSIEEHELFDELPDY